MFSIHPAGLAAPGDSGLSCVDIAANPKWRGPQIL
jgi:hypothetical protein